jgi:hypothetical protein
MANRLEPVNLIDFTGGLNLRRNQFQLDANESPEMRNIAIDPLGGIYTRRGWDRYSKDIVEPETTWDPRRAHLAQLSDGTDIIYIAANNKIFASNPDTTFSDIGLIAEANPHMADFTSHGDDTYIACGRERQMAKRSGTNPPALLTLGGAGSWNDDYLNPTSNVAPAAECIEGHSGYLFAANLIEDGVTLPNRIRWSHPTSPEDWAQADFIDIEFGGNYIAALMSYEDHLLIFKPDGIWALYGYDADSWQLVQKSSTVGSKSPQVVTRNEAAVFFYSASDRGGIYAYTGERPVEISEQLRYALETLIHPELIWVGWVGRKLWVTLPWTYDGPTDDNVAVFVFDPSVGENGAWAYFMSQASSLGPIVSGSNTDTQIRPLGVLRSPEVPCVVRLEANERAADRIWEYAVWGFVDPAQSVNPTNPGFLVTGNDEEIALDGMPGDQAFETVYRTPWITADWPSRKKSFRRPDFICRITGTDHNLQVRSFRDYEEMQAKRQHTLVVPAGAPVPPDSSAPPGQVAAVWGRFRWNDGTKWNQPGTGPPSLTQGGQKQGASIRRGSSFGLCRALQLRVAGMTPAARWGIDAIVLKVVMRRFR